MEQPIQLSDDLRDAIEDFRSRHQTGVLVLLFTDIVGSTKLKQQLGDTVANALIDRHCQQVRRLLGDFPEADEIDTAGDSFLLAFVRPSDAVKFSMRLQRELRLLSAKSPRPLQVRIGIHWGEIYIERESDEGPVKEVLGIQVDTAARIMSLALGGQTLMSRGVFDSARAIVQNEEIPEIAALAWRNHGPYTLKGVEEPREITEVGETGLAPLTPPPDSDKAKSIAPIDGGLVVGWRPSPGSGIPTAPGWIVLEKLGEGGFGEVWKARKTAAAQPDAPATKMADLEALPVGATAAFKFCFDLAHARALRREATLFKLLQKKQSDLKHTVKLLDYQLAQAPIYLTLEYIPGKNLAQWLREEGAAINAVQRLQMMAPVALSVAEIHAAGIIINDIKPANILVRIREGGRPEFLLTDLGIGQIRDRKFLKDTALTKTTGFTKTLLTLTPGSSGTQAGSILYLAPELLEGEKATVASDVYALGVTLLQVAAGNPRLAASAAWKRHVRPAQSRRLVANLIRGDSHKRQRDLRKVSRNLRALPRRIRINAWIKGVCVGILLLLTLFFGYRELILTPRMQQLAANEQKAAAKLGLATNVDAYNKKYPRSRDAELTIMDAARLFEAFDLPDNLASANPATSQAAAPATEQLRALNRDLNALVNIKPDAPIDYGKLGALVTMNRRALDDLVAFNVSNVPHDELNWFWSDNEPRPFPTIYRKVGKDEVTGRNPREMMYYPIYFFPAVVYHEVQSANAPRAYELLYKCLYLLKCVKAQSISLTENRGYNFFEERLHGLTLALMKTAPPDKARAEQLYDICDPAQKIRELTRGYESAYLKYETITEWHLGIRQEWPSVLLGKGAGKDAAFGEGAPIKGALFKLLYTNDCDSFWRLVHPEIWAEARFRTQCLILVQEGFEVRRNTEADFQHRLSAVIGSEPVYEADMLRPSLSRASLLRAALLLRIAELEAGGKVAEMPESLARLLDKPPPLLDYLGDTPTSQIKYRPHYPRPGAYVLSHNSASDQTAPFEYEGKWGRGE